MDELKFRQIREDDYEIFKDLLILYNKEIGADNYDSETFAKSCINIQGAYDRHLELVFIGDEPIGFLYGKVDHENHKGHKKIGYGYIMEFYVTPEHRRKGYGRLMFRRLERHFSGHGVKRMYLNTSVNGESFWKAIGFTPTDEIQPHNNKVIWEKSIRGDDNDTVTISVSEYLTHELAEKIAYMQWHSKTPKDINGIRQFIYDSKYDSDSFNVVAVNSEDEVVGRLFCLKNKENPKRWYYGDLAVIPSYRRMGIATRMIQTAIQKISDMGGKILHSYTEPENIPSKELHKSLGFIEQPILPFDHLINDGRIMFELNLSNQYNVISATVDEAGFVMMFYTQNLEALHGKFIPFHEWKEILSRDDPYELNFLVCNGAVPIAWLRINGLENKEKAWISMLAVSDNYHRQGVGTFAIKFAEDYVKSRGFTKLGIRTTDDNLAAQSLYTKCGYTIADQGNCTTGDGVARMGIGFEKNLM